MKYNIKIYLIGIFILLCFSLYISNGQADSAQVFPDKLVIFGPTSSLDDYIQTINSTGPHLLAIAVVRAIEDPKCDTPPEGLVTRGDTTYCNLRSEIEDLLSDKYPSIETKLLKNKFLIHYWYPQDKNFGIKKGEQLVVFLTQSKTPDVFGATMILRYTDEVVTETREALAKIQIKYYP